MQALNLRNASRPHKQPWMRPLLLVLLVVMLLLTWPTESSGQDAPADSVLVPTSLLVDARKTIDELDARVAFQDSLLAAQKHYYIRLLELKDQHIEILEDTVKDALGSDTKNFLDKLLWGLAGYGLHAAGD